MIWPVLPYRLIALAGAALAISFAAGYGGYRLANARWQIKWDQHQTADAKQREQAAIESLRIEKHFLNRIQTAEGSYAKARQTIDDERNRADAVAKRLRDHIAAGMADGGQSIGACHQRAATCWELFGEADSAAGEMAAAADRHASEVKLLLDAWPQQE